MALINRAVLTLFMVPSFYALKGKLNSIICIWRGCAILLPIHKKYHFFNGIIELWMDLVDSSKNKK